MKVQYCAAYRDWSGYGEAARSYIYCLARAGVAVSVVPLRFEHLEQDRSPNSELADSLVGDENDHSAPVRIIHATPENFSSLQTPNQYCIGYVPWETNRLPDSWVTAINRLQEVWIPSAWCGKVFRDSGVTVPITEIPHAVDPNPEIAPPPISPDPPPFERDVDDLNLYSIGQWHDRKNLKGLIRAYYKAFSLKDRVHLVLKTYHTDPSSQAKGDIEKTVEELWRETGRKAHRPKLTLLLRHMPIQEINLLHSWGSCYVTMTRGEGFGLPIAQAMALGKPVLAPNHPSLYELLNECNSYLVDCGSSPVEGMPWAIYDASQRWGEPSVDHAAQLMRTIYQNRDEAKEKGLAGQRLVTEFNCPQAIAQLMLRRLGDIYWQLGMTQQPVT